MHLHICLCIRNGSHSKIVISLHGPAAAYHVRRKPDMAYRSPRSALQCSCYYRAEFQNKMYYACLRVHHYQTELLFKGNFRNERSFAANFSSDYNCRSTTFSGSTAVQRNFEWRSKKICYLALALKARKAKGRQSSALYRRTCQQGLRQWTAILCRSAFTIWRRRARSVTNGHRTTSAKSWSKRIRTDTSVDAIEINDHSRVACSTSYGGAFSGLADRVSARVRSLFTIKDRPLGI